MVENKMSLNKKIHELEQRLADLQDDYNYVFNSPILRFFRGVRQLRSNPKIAINDIWQSLRHALFGRNRPVRKKNKSTVFEDVSNKSLFEAHPLVFLRAKPADEPILLIGERLAGVDVDQIEIKPSNYLAEILRHRYSDIVVNLDRCADSGDWEGLFTMSNMRINRYFSDICDVAERNAMSIIIAGGSDSDDLPLLSEFLASNSKTISFKSSVNQYFAQVNA